MLGQEKLNLVIILSTKSLILSLPQMIEESMRKIKLTNMALVTINAGAVVDVKQDKRGKVR